MTFVIGCLCLRSKMYFKYKRGAVFLVHDIIMIFSLHILDHQQWLYVLLYIKYSSSSYMLEENAVPSLAKLVWDLTCYSSHVSSWLPWALLPEICHRASHYWTSECMRFPSCHTFTWATTVLSSPIFLTLD